jgi:hypothetical protein
VKNQKAWREAARRILWGDREVILPHILEHRDCGVFQVVQVMCYDAGWTLDSYVLAAFFDREELLTEATK